MIAHSWGRAKASECYWLTPTQELSTWPFASELLPRGLGRSYGDSNLLTGGTLLSTQGLDRLLGWSPPDGLLRAQAGVSLRDIIATFLPKGWFLPVTPGSSFVTLGGAVANDVHGKNHHLRGCFGNHVSRFELVRSTGERLICSQTENAEMFKATVGGLGLTGFINWVELTLMPVAGSKITVMEERFDSLAQLYALDDQLAATHEYTVAWFDCLSYRKGKLRGIYSAGSHASNSDRHCVMKTGPSIPFAPPISPVNGLTLRAFNALYSRKPIARGVDVDVMKFMYPLDAISHWNRLYGKPGFYQYQCVIPTSERDALEAMLQAIRASGQGSFLAVLKRFGDVVSPGLMSFPKPGYTLALDFPNRGERMHKLFTTLDNIVQSAGGRLYPAKDGAMSAAMFRAGYPHWQQLEAMRDPAINSDFWRRVTTRDTKP
jgi:FAD/FMN-containing dehydrogenase